MFFYYLPCIKGGVGFENIDQFHFAMSGINIVQGPKLPGRLQSYMSDTVFCIHGLGLKKTKVDMHMAMSPAVDYTDAENLVVSTQTEPMTITVPKKVLSVKFPTEYAEILLWPESLSKLCSGLFELHNAINTRVARQIRALKDGVFQTWEIQTTGDHKILLLGIEKELLLGATLVVLKWSSESQQYLYKGEPVAEPIVYQDEAFICLRDLDRMTDFVTMMSFNISK